MIIGCATEIMSTLASGNLVVLFENFCARILECKQTIIYNSDEKSSTTLNVVAKKIIKILESDIAAVGSIADKYSQDTSSTIDVFARVREVQYVMAALADEIFLRMEWQDAKYWEKNLLEEKVFGTHVSGQNFFKNIDRIVAHGTLADNEVATVYLHALGMGFCGKYGTNNNAETAQYKQKLFSFIHHKDMDYANTSDNALQLFPNSYIYTIEGGHSFKSSHMHAWRYVCITGVLIYIAFAYAVWHENTYELFFTIQQLLSLIGQ